MELVNEVVIRKLTYTYRNEIEKDVHSKQMIKDGWHISRNIWMDNDLTVTYEKSNWVNRNLVIL